jgi:diguanylate cyclase
MPARVLRTRVLARAAVAGLALGLLALAALAAWGSETNTRATAELRKMNTVSRVWSQVFQEIDAENEAAHDFVNAGGKAGGPRLAASIGSADPSLDWLSRHAAPDEAEQVVSIQAAYRTQASALRTLLAAGNAGDTERVMALHEDGEATTAALHAQVTDNFVRSRVEASRYLDESDRRMRRIRGLGLGLFGFELALLVICTGILLGYQRRVECQAATSQHQALHDSLTGLANRDLLAERTGQAVLAAQRHGDQVGLLLIDLDRFKEVNDTLGHHYGDLLLQQIAARLHETVRDMDTVARLGGDEFAVLLPRVSSVYEVEQVGRRLVTALARPADLDGLVVDVSASLGVAIYPNDSIDADQLLQHADIAMYMAKRAHLGVAVYDSSLDGSSPKQLTLLGELRRAVEEGGELVLHYQPKAEMESGVVCGVEALVRWQHPAHGLLGPSEFIPLAEQTGLIEALTRYVLTEALAQCRTWRLQGTEVPVAVNVAARCLLDLEFPAQVAELLDRHEVPATLLTLELTESAIVADPDRAQLVLAALRALGVRLSIDDFGTGYSSMAYLRTLPVDELKIDRTFVTDMRNETSNKAIVRAVLDLARNLDLRVVAEGVEDSATWTELGLLGCDSSQGYFLSRPLPAAQITAWLAEQHEARAADPVG